MQSNAAARERHASTTVMHESK